MANVTEEKIQVASIVAPTSSDAGYTPTIKINLGDKTYDIDNDGKMATADLASYISETYGKRPIEHDINATLDAWFNNGSTVVKMATSETFQVKAIPVAPVIDEGYYLVGDMFNAEGVDGWNTVSAKQAFKHSDERFYATHCFFSFEDFRIQLKRYNYRDYNCFPMRPLGWKSPKDTLHDFIKHGVTYV